VRRGTRGKPQPARPATGSRRWRGIAIAACIGAASGPACADLGYVGIARDPSTDAPMYEEHHLLRERDGRAQERLVLYRCVDGALFARKRVSYGDAPAAPDFVLEDGRFGYREGAGRAVGTRETWFRRDRDAAERRATIAPGANLVIDAGFDEFVRIHWERLQQGDALTVDFLVPSRLETLGFKLRRTGSESIDSAPVSVFRLSLGGLIGFFAPDIDVAYRDRDRRLMRFEGLTNIRADRDANLVARIEFPPARERAAVADAEWAAATLETLTDCDPGP
jgi:hypothetical protein